MDVTQTDALTTFNKYVSVWNNQVSDLNIPETKIENQKEIKSAYYGEEGMDYRGDIYLCLIEARQEVRSKPLDQSIYTKEGLYRQNKLKFANEFVARTNYCNFCHFFWSKLKIKTP